MQVGQTLRIGGWVKTGREAGGGAWVFLEVNDGSCFQSLQVPQTAFTQGLANATPEHIQPGKSIAYAVPMSRKHRAASYLANAPSQQSSVAHRRLAEGC